MMRAMTNTITAGLATLTHGLFATGCGGDDKSESSWSESEGAKTACKADALKGDSGLPAAFPAPGELTLTRTRKDGPTIVVDGDWAAEVDEAQVELKDAIGKAR